MNMEQWVVWLITAVFLIIVEMVTPSVFFFLCFGLGALITALLSYLGFSNWVLWINFFVSSIALILIAKPFASKYMQGESRPSNADELIGKEGVVLEALGTHKTGLVKVRGELWKAEAAEEINPDSLVEVLSIDGTHLIVKKKEAH